MLPITQSPVYGFSGHTIDNGDDWNMDGTVFEMQIIREGIKFLPFYSNKLY
jgi:hypothetical protein